jgi:Metallo-beta-lactamase superfamily
MLHHRCQWPVGQGFFHSGRVGNPGADSRDGGRPFIHYVYDCGSIVPYARARDREIKSYRREVRGGFIDLLFLSHMHADHLNGLPQLLSRQGRGAKLDTVVMPLVDDVERLIAFAGSLAFGATDPGDRFYIDFIVDPISALGRFSPRQIILVRAGRRGTPGAGAPDLDSPPPERGHPTRSEAEEEDSPFPTGDWKLIGSGIVRSLGRRSKNGDPASGASASAPRVFEMEDTVAIAIDAVPRGAWLLAPYVDPAVRGGRRAFLNALAKRLGITPRTLTTQLANTEARSKLIANKQTSLKAAYQAIDANLNLTSMLLLSTPVSDRPFAADAYQWLCGRSAVRRSEPCNSARVGWLGTGDADLKTNRRLRAFLRHYRRHLRVVYTLTVPHHGAESNFHQDLIKKVGPGLCTLAADQFRDWRHPATSVVQAIASTGIELRVVTSAPESAVHELVSIDWNCAR